MDPRHRTIREALEGIMPYPFKAIIEVKDGHLLLFRRDGEPVYWLTVKEIRDMDDRAFGFFMSTCLQTYTDPTPRGNEAATHVNEALTWEVRVKIFYVKANLADQQYEQVFAGGRCMSELLPVIRAVRTWVLKHIENPPNRVFRYSLSWRVSSRSTAPRVRKERR